MDRWERSGAGVVRIKRVEKKPSARQGTAAFTPYMQDVDRTKIKSIRCFILSGLHMDPAYPISTGKFISADT